MPVDPGRAGAADGHHTPGRDQRVRATTHGSTRSSAGAGASVEDPVAVFAKHARRLGLLHTRVGIEVPAYYLHPHHYVQLKDLLGSALVAEATNLVHDLKLVKSPAEFAYIRKAAAIADDRHGGVRQGAARRRERAGAGGQGLRFAAVVGQRPRRQHDEPGVGGAFRLQPRRADRARDPARRFRQHRVRLGLSALHIHHRPAVQHRRAHAAHGRALRHRPPRRRRLHRRDSRRRAGGRAARGGAQGDRGGRYGDVSRSHDRLRSGARLPADLGRAVAHAGRQPPTRCAPAW